MNILIIGGLLGFAVVAIMGAVLLGIGEDRAEKANGTAPAPASSTSPTRQLTGALPTTPPATRATGQLLPLDDDDHPVLHRTGQLPAPNEEERLVILNGQIHEITNELRVLAQKAGELEQRLGNLSAVLERQQYYQADSTTPLSIPRSDTSSF